MALTGTRTYVGFGFGAIQAGLFLYEAFQSGNFGRLVVAEVLPDVVEVIRANGGYFSCNIAHADHVEQAAIGPVEILNPADEQDREVLIEALASAEEIGTAIPSVAYYASSTPASLHRVLAAGVQRKVMGQGPRAVVYTAENHNHAAEILESHVMPELSKSARAAAGAHVQFLNTVIGKMSGLVKTPEEMQAWGVAPVTPQETRAFLVEAFNRILISAIQFDDKGPFQRGIANFNEKSDLLPFEEAKLYGHNATHALAAYIGAARGVERITELRGLPGVIPFLRTAFIEESGATLIQKYHGEDPLFTGEGYQEYADDLLERMTNPYLRDTVERVGRDPRRKLGWNDRLIGTVRLALQHGISPSHYAFGAVVAATRLNPSLLDRDAEIADVLLPLWNDDTPDQEELRAVIRLLTKTRKTLQQWTEAGFPDLERFFAQRS